MVNFWSYILTQTVKIKQEAQLLLRDRATQKSPKDCLNLMHHVIWLYRTWLQHCQLAINYKHNSCHYTHLYFTINGSTKLKKINKNTHSRIHTHSNVRKSVSVHTMHIDGDTQTSPSPTVRYVPYKLYFQIEHTSLKISSFLLAITSDISRQSNIFIHSTAKSVLRTSNIFLKMHTTAKCNDFICAFDIAQA